MISNILSILFLLFSLRLKLQKRRTIKIPWSLNMIGGEILEKEGVDFLYRTLLFYNQKTRDPYTL